MKKIQFLLFGFVAASFLFASCDKVDEGLRVIDVQNVPDNINDTIFFADSVFVDHKQVLLEDFTGHKCVNCPEAAIAAHGWAEDYNHRLIIYSVHAGFQALPDPTGDYTMDFTNPVSDEIFNFFGQPFNPTATVDRVEYNGNVILLFITGDSENAVAAEIAKANRVNMNLKNTYFPKSNSVLIDVTTSFIVPTDLTYKLVVMIAEDNIVAPQKNNNEDFGAETVPDWMDYVHHNVLRDAVSATFGSSINDGNSITVNEPYESTYLYTIDENWVTSNCNIIAYVIEDETGEIIQVAELSIKTE